MVEARVNSWVSGMRSPMVRWVPQFASGRAKGRRQGGGPVVLTGIREDDPLRRG